MFGFTQQAAHELHDGLLVVFILIQPAGVDLRFAHRFQHILLDAGTVRLQFGSGCRPQGKAAYERLVQQIFIVRCRRG